jgi:geranylgeranyl diphosphate synthase, type II
MNKSLNNHFITLTSDKKPDTLYKPIEYILTQEGKRIRPKLVMLATELFDGESEMALFPAAGFEMLHNFTLIHDDIMDNAPLRRGKETVYKKWNSNIAILSGDALATMALEEILKTPADKETVLKLISLFARTSIEICEGQQYDLNFESSEEVSIEEYVEMIRLKTAVMLAACLKAGAIISRTTTENQNRIYQYGIDLGIAFQLMDDLLDVYSDKTIFGKEIGGDIEYNKKTYPYLRALQDGSSSQKQLLKILFSSSELKASEKFNAVKEVFDNLDIKVKTENLIKEYMEKALSGLDKISAAPEKKEQLIEMTAILCNRIK